jgi:hypothetical protein
VPKPPLHMQLPAVFEEAMARKCIPRRGRSEVQSSGIIHSLPKKAGPTLYLTFANLLDTVLLITVLEAESLFLV